MNAPMRKPGDNVRPALITVEQLAKDFGHLTEATVVIERRGKEAPPVLEDDEDLAIINRLVADCRDETKKFTRAEKSEKEPFQEAIRVIGGFIDGLERRVVELKNELERRATLYLSKKADTERRARDEAARLAREEADRKTQQAIADAAAATKPGEAAAVMETATAAQAKARTAETKAVAKSADLARTHTDGGTATLVDDWKFEITDYGAIDLNALRQNFSRPDVEKAIRRHVELHKDAQPIAGVRIFNSPKARMTK